MLKIISVIKYCIKGRKKVIETKIIYETMKISSIKNEYFKVANDVICKPENLKNFCSCIALTTHKKRIDTQVKYTEQIKVLKIILQD